MTAPTLLRDTLTPSLNGTPWPRALGRREWVACAFVGTVGVMGVVGAGDCERDEDAVEEFWGGPRAQADFDGSWGGIFDIDAVEDLLIL